MNFSSIKEKHESELLDYLRVHGCNGDWDAIASSLNEKAHIFEEPRSAIGIRNSLTSLHKLNMANKRYKQIHEGYEPILKTITKDASIMELTFIMPELLDYKADFGCSKVPIGGVDYAAIYRATASLMRGHSPPELDVATAQKLQQLIGRLFNHIAEKRESLDLGPISIPENRMAGMPASLKLRARKIALEPERYYVQKLALLSATTVAEIRQDLLNTSCFIKFRD